MNEQAKRKQNRLKEYDYSTSGAYYITVCTKNRQRFFGKILYSEDDIYDTPTLELSKIGEMVETCIETIPKIYPSVVFVQHIVMPDHIHLILLLDSLRDNGRQVAAPTISRIISQFKRTSSINAGFNFWQKSFYDHVIRNEKEYQRLMKYIELNPIRWANRRL